MSQLQIQLYKKMFLIRTAEEAIREHYKEDGMKTPMHLSVGEEAIAVAICQALEKDGQIFGTYRNHGLYLAKTGETDMFFAELYGKMSGMAKGKAGSMHLAYPALGLMGTSAVVATTIPVAVGTAFANWQLKNGKMTAVFFGDGAVDEGVFWESLNLASLKQLPILFICEDNGLAIHSPVKERHAYGSLTEIVSKFQYNIFSSDSTDAEELFKLGKQAILACRKTGKPSFMHLKYYRYYQHVGTEYDFRHGYRPESEFKEWQARDPIALMRKKLLADEYTEQKLAELEREIVEQVEKSLKRAIDAPFAPPEELYKDVFA